MVLGHGADSYPNEAFLHMMTTHGPDVDPFGGHGVTDLFRGLIQNVRIDQDKVTFGWVGFEPGEFIDLVEDIISAFDHSLSFQFLVVSILQLCKRGGDTDQADIPRETDPVEIGRKFGIAEKISDAEPGQAVRFGESPVDDHVRIFFDPAGFGFHNI